MLASSGQSKDNDVMWTISSDAFPFQRQLKETQVRIIELYYLYPTV